VASLFSLMTPNACTWHYDAECLTKILAVTLVSAVSIGLGVLLGYYAFLHLLAFKLES
jgi:hypothetical protein